MPNDVSLSPSLQRRSNRRRRVRARADVVCDGTASPGILLDVTERGVRFGNGATFKLNTVVDLVVHGQTLPARVAWSREGEAGLDLIEAIQPQVMATILRYGAAGTTPLNWKSIRHAFVEDIVGASDTGPFAHCIIPEPQPENARDRVQF